MTNFAKNATGRKFTPIGSILGAKKVWGIKSKITLKVKPHEVINFLTKLEKNSHFDRVISTYKNFLNFIYIYISLNWSKSSQ